MLTSVRPNGLEDTPQFKIDIDQEKRRRWVFLSTTLTPLWALHGAAAM
nr:RND efflux system inner membrane transporter CmeB [uncultured bacterium]